MVGWLGWIIFDVDIRIMVFGPLTDSVDIWKTNQNCGINKETQLSAHWRYVKLFVSIDNEIP